MTELEKLKNTRNVTLRFLWGIFNDISKITTINEFEKQDIEIWKEITKHTAIQENLKMTMDLKNEN